MKKKDERNLNITIKNQEKENKGELIISVSALFSHLKKYFAVWLVFAIIGAMLATAFACFQTFVSKPAVTALVSFTYSGIEKGKDPAGNTFDANSIKSPDIIEAALSDLDLELSNLDSIRKNIIIDGIIPEDAIDRITAYKHVYEKAANENLKAVEAMLDVSYYPTLYKITFKYGGTSLDREDSSAVLNAMLEEYRTYFYKKYGFNQQLGTSIHAVDYSDYDYAEQIDIFNDSLSTIERYLKNLATDDNNLFRSNETGFSFNDLYRAAQTIRSIDLDRISSNITVNNITKDKTASLAYCDYRIESLERNTASLQDTLETIEDSIAKYEKDTILIFGNGTDGNDTSYSQASEEYDRLIDKRVNTSSQLADAKQNIEYYKSRKNALNSNKTATKEMKQSVEEQLEALGNKVKELVDITEKTANEYYQNVEFKNAYSILVPAESAASAALSKVVKNAVIPIVIAEALIFALYLMIAFVASVISASRKETLPADGEDDGDDGDIEDVINAIEDAAEDESDSKKKDKK